MTQVQIPYGRQDIRDEDIDAVVAVLKSDWLTQGPAVPRFEALLAEQCNAGHAVAMSNATAALHIACLAMGLGPGDVLWTSPNTFVASANCALYCGASVDFVDIDLATGNMSVEALAAKLEEADAEGKLPKIVVPVHFAGQSCDMRAIKALSERYGFRILEDAAHAVGGRYRDGPVGDCRYSDAAVFSFHPVKIVTTGEGGAVLTNDSELAARMARLRSHGAVREPERMRGKPDGGWYYEIAELGWNYRLTDMQAALGCSQMVRLSDYIARRAALADRYDRLLANSGLALPGRDPNCRSAWHLYVVGWNEQAFGISRADAFARLRAGGIGVQVHYIPVHLQPYFRDRGFAPGQFPNAEAHYARSITIPLFAKLTDEQQEIVVDRLVGLAR
ncbi:MAG TPA: UDP-4-amino-4,6-dideoxy-N-acetyl-beta-L-altrosamine transaminase [Pseudolabrys sp.]|nr:UDP-4-amino-4,6-dideoxy-N-acetyl-beta-L-altrosamine transaminase [Pseudolabrys sp.]